MTIDKAIEYLNSLHQTDCCKEVPDYDEAVQLGIEALKEIQHLRKIGAFCYQNPLPGETEN